MKQTYGVSEKSMAIVMLSKIYRGKSGIIFFFFEGY
jgi:hypothetical protein